MMDKRAFRADAKAKRDNIPEAARSTADRAIFDMLVSEKAFLQAKSIFAYISFGSEVSTSGMIEYAIGCGKTVAVPRCDIKKHEMTFFVIHGLQDLKKGAYGIYEPDEGCERLDSADICLVPGVAFSSGMDRMGYGAGYYDRFLYGRDIIKVGLTYGELLFDEIPCEEYDIKMDMIICENRILRR